MPKTEIDYSNTIIYKITCKDPEIKDVYVGHTTNFVQRKHAHKQSCNNPKTLNYDCKLYNIIREKGGWSNWKMEIINFFNCSDHYEARKKEQEYFISLNANLNSIEPMPKPKEKPVVIKPVKIKNIYICDVCNINCYTLKGLEGHNKTNKHKKRTANKQIEESTNNTDDSLDDKFTPQNANYYNCEKCDFKCSKKCDWERHILTRKHRKDYNGLQPTPPTPQTFVCEQCGSNYKHRQGLWKHSKICNQNNKPPDDKSTQIDPSLFFQLIKQNDDFKNLIIEQTKIIMEQNKTIVDSIKHNKDG